MSYDLMVFNPHKAPQRKVEFMNWYELQTEWEEDHDYNDPNVTSPELKNWYLDMIKVFPAMNGPFTTENIDNPKITSYSIGYDVIYSAFAWSESENAYQKMLELAKKNKVVFFDASGSSDIIFPDENEKLKNKSTMKPWWKFW